MRRTAAALLLTTAGLLTAGQPAVAAGGHGGLVASDPAAGATVTIAPLFVRLDFGHELLDLGVAVRVVGPDGAVVSSGPPRRYPATVTQALAGDLAAGAYRVSWRVTADDGRPITGSFGFTAEEPTQAAAAPAALPVPTAKPTPGPESGAEPAGAGPRTWAELGGALAVIAGIAAAVVHLARRRRSFEPDG